MFRGLLAVYVLCFASWVLQMTQKRRACVCMASRKGLDSKAILFNKWAKITLKNITLVWIGIYWYILVLQLWSYGFTVKSSLLKCESEVSYGSNYLNAEPKTTRSFNMCLKTGGAVNNIFTVYMHHIALCVRIVTHYMNNTNYQISQNEKFRILPYNFYSVSAQSVYNKGKALNKIYMRICQKCHYILPLRSINPFKPQNHLLRTTSLFINMKRETGCSFCFFFFAFFGANKLRTWMKKNAKFKSTVRIKLAKVKSKIK